jgi:hypothetical protein
MANPSPVPPYRRVVELSASSKAPNSLESASGAIRFRILDRKQQQRRIDGLFRKAESYCHFAGIGEFDGVAGEIEHRLLQGRRVTFQAENNGRRLDPQPQALGPGRLMQDRVQVAQQGGEIERRFLQRELPASIFDRSRMLSMMPSRCWAAVSIFPRRSA